MGGYRELKVWQLAMRLTVEVYRFTASFPKTETYGLASQLRRAAVSIPSNLAEGHSRRTNNELSRFASIARGSLAELETQILLATELGLADKSTADPLLERADEIGRMITGLIRSVSSPPSA